MRLKVPAKTKEEPDLISPLEDKNVIIDETVAQFLEAAAKL